MSQSLPIHSADDSNLDRLHAFVAELSANRWSDWAWERYKDTLWRLLALVDARRMLEIGGGRWPCFSPEEIAGSGVRYVVNDVSEGELALGPPQFDKACFDIAQPIDDRHQPLMGTIDLMFSKMVFEHVADAMVAYRNIHRLLAPGGVCLNFHPVLYSPPFVVNRLLPESASSRVLRLFFPNRTPDEVPKYPAHYDLCVVSRSVRNRLREVGFRGVWQAPFWRHDYFERLPALHRLDRAGAELAERNDWTRFASYCYTIVAK